MDFAKLFKTGGILAILSFFTTAITSVFLCLSIYKTGARITFAIILLLFSFVILNLAFFKADEKSPKVSYMFVGFTDLVSGFVWFFIGDSFNLHDSYINRLVIYALFTMAYSTTFACFWSFVTRKFFHAILAEHAIDEKQETLLYIVLNVIFGLIIALVVPISNAYSVSKLCTDGIKYSCGFWFVDALLGFLIGFLLINTSSTASIQSIVTPISQDAAYDGIN